MLLIRQFATNYCSDSLRRSFMRYTKKGLRRRCDPESALLTGYDIGYHRSNSSPYHSTFKLYLE